MPPTPTPVQLIQGSVHAGQQAVSGAHVYAYAANTTGYGGPGIAASSLNASVSMLKSVAGSTTVDSSGNYFVTTASDGSFSISGDYTCTQNQQLYLYALGGNNGTSTNSASGMMAVLGGCPSAGNFNATVPYAWVNEVSTVAAAYAMAGFASDATHVSSSGTALSQTGIVNAFANAANLATLASGAALATTPAGNGTTLQSRLNTIANILHACVGSTGPSSAGCSTLFTNAANGAIVPTETASAVINIAHHAAANVSALLALATNAAFSPTVSAANDLTLWITYTAGLQYPQGVAIDASGDVWIPNDTANNVIELSSSGAVLSGAGGFTGGGMKNLSDVAIDRTGNVWVANYGSNSITELSSAGTALSGTTGYTAGAMNGPYRIAIDAAGNAWVANVGAFSTPALGFITKLSSSGVVLSGTGGYGQLGASGQYDHLAIDGSGNLWAAAIDLPGSNGAVMEFSTTGNALASYSQANGTIAHPSALAIDTSGNAWIGAYYNGTASSVYELSNAGTVLTTVGANGIYQSNQIAMDGAGTAWVASATNAVTGISSTGQILTGTNGYLTYGTASPSGIAVDGSGNIWTSIGANPGMIVEIIGAAAPVITPIAAGLPTVSTTNGSSKLGTRP